MAKKPDFIIIGAMKCATSTLHTQLALQPGIFMSTPKEPNFFSDDDQYAKGINEYLSLFGSASESDLCGESSTHYTKLPDYPRCVERLTGHLPDIKLIYVMRHPIDRLVSHYIHQWSQGAFSCDINHAVSQYPELVSYSCYSKQLEPYIQAYGKNKILPIFFEAVKSNPQRELEKIAQFIGYQKPVIWTQELAKQNASNERIKQFVGYEFLIDSEIMTLLRRSLIPPFLRNLVKKKLTMQERPVLDPLQTEQLTKTFNDDLQVLGAWLGTDLCCDNFAATVMSGSLTWN